jgi:hypothetical protein
VWTVWTFLTKCGQCGLWTFITKCGQCELLKLSVDNVDYAIANGV